jgi:microcompartment protein CcmK/EutM
MKRGLVIGEIWATRKAPGLAGRQLKLVLEYPDSPEPPQGRWSPPQVAALGMAPLVVAVDTLDVRSGQEVLLAYGSGARNVLVPGPDNRHELCDAAVAMLIEPEADADPDADPDADADTKADAVPAATTPRGAASADRAAADPDGYSLTGRGA